jgi:2-keto-4-pentenoate hydratase/2-oxohepta-3-ene-1,7-dioic acid hydratase in catechol pathway
MKLCRFEHQGRPQVGFYRDDAVVPLSAVAPDAPAGDSLLPLLPGGEKRSSVRQWQAAAEKAQGLPLADVKLLVPVPHPSKVLLLAGNYSAHIEEGGGRAEERAKTFPYVFMKPPTTTLTNPGDPVRIPAVSPKYVDWELELGVIIGRRCHGVSEQDALSHVAGYTVVNDISDRKFRPNPQRNERSKDEFFDWMHGKWHDTFCPMGPCVLPADEVDDPQTLKLDLRVNGHTEQDASTADMVFPVAAVIAFICSFVTLEPGDVISTGTPAGVGAAKNKFLKPGDVLEAEIGRIGILRNPVVGA